MPRLFCLLLTLVSLLVAQAPPATDAQIEAQLHDRLAKSVVGKDGFVAKVKGGVVTWEGTTTVAQHKGAATRMAKSSGARRVVNNIRVKKTGAPEKRAAAPPKSAPSSAAAPSVAPIATPAAPTSTPPLKRVTVQWRPLRP